MKNRKKHILIIGSSQGVYGGIEAYMLAIADAVALWSEFEVILCYKLVEGYRWEDELIKMTLEKNYQVRFVSKASVKLISLIRWSDVLHIQNMPPDIVLPAYLFRRKLYLTIHNRKIAPNSIRTKVWNFCRKLANERWYNSSFVKNTWEVDQLLKNSYVVPTVCVMPEITSPFSERRGFLFVGRWIENKGIEEIIHAYSQLSDVEQGLFPLTILGKGPIRDKVIQLIKDLDLIDRIILPGFVSDKEKELYFSRTKWLLAPANTKEDLGLTPIEARNISIPSIVSNDGGLPESGGPAALIVAPGDINDLLEKMKIAVHMSENEYVQRANLAKSSLNDFLQPIEFYRDKFSKI